MMKNLAEVSRMVWVVWYQIPGDTAPSPEYCNTREEAEDFVNRVIEAGWYVIKMEEVKG